ncbi:MAG TPA: glycosyltransferase family A protein [Acidimicrobiales bacterium]|nr:glycosyltransferase family A protein [Acidimicrobiales bacterium]
MTACLASVIVRAKDKAATLEATIASLREQTVPVEVVVVDSGSTDGSLDIAHRQADVVAEIDASSFTFGHSLNVGASASSGPVLFALSAHCRAERPDWIERSLRHYERPTVAGTCGLTRSPDHSPLDSARVITPADVLANPHWGFSNHASSWRRAAWEERPFDANLRSCEDKDWMWRSMAAGWEFVADPDLAVATPHRREEGVRALWRREYLEHRVITSILQYDNPTFGQLARSWWSDFPGDSRFPRWARRMSPLRAVELVAGYLGERAGAAERGPQTVRFDSPDGVARRIPE